MSKVISIVGGVHITREDNGIRITIPTVHSSAWLTQDEAKRLTSDLVKAFRVRKPSTDGGV